MYELMNQTLGKIVKPTESHIGESNVAELSGGI